MKLSSSRVRKSPFKSRSAAKLGFPWPVLPLSHDFWNPNVLHRAHKLSAKVLEKHPAPPVVTAITATPAAPRHTSSCRPHQAARILMLANTHFRLETSSRHRSSNSPFCLPLNEHVFFCAVFFLWKTIHLESYIYNITGDLSHQLGLPPFALSSLFS